VDRLIALSAATLILVAIPGPNVALIVANSIRYGLGMGAITVLGTTLGVAIQLWFVLLGMAALIEMAVDALTWIRWAGVAYLFWLGIQTWREPVADLGRIEAAPAMFWRGCLVATVNPKTLLFNAAFLPQFVSTDGDAQTELIVVAGVFLSVLLLGDLLWVALAGSAEKLLAKQSAVRNKITGAALVLASIGLALAHRR
jgi:threonine/homoserine/homoserine lactone efflux protein